MNFGIRLRVCVIFVFVDYSCYFYFIIVFIGLSELRRRVRSVGRIKNTREGDECFLIKLEMNLFSFSITTNTERSQTNN